MDVRRYLYNDCPQHAEGSERWYMCGPIWSDTASAWLGGRPFSSTFTLFPLLSPALLFLSLASLLIAPVGELLVGGVLHRMLQARSDDPARPPRNIHQAFLSALKNNNRQQSDMLSSRAAFGPCPPVSSARPPY